MGDAGEGQECGTSRPGLFQIADHALGSLLILRDDILDVAAQGRLDGRLVFGFRLDNIRHHADDTLLLAFSFHHGFDTAAVALVTLRQIGKRLQLGFLLVIEHLGIPQFLIPARQLLPEKRKPLLHRLLLFPQFFDSCPYSLELFFQLLDSLRLLCLVRFGPQQPGIQLCPANVDLLQHSVIASHLGLDGGTVI